MASSRNRSSTDLIQVLINRLGCHVHPGERVCVALSGGVDSVALLHATVMSSRELAIVVPTALHVNHGLNPKADAWEGFCRDICKGLDVPLDVRCVQVVPDGEGIEAAARKARHAQFEDADSDWILLGHHRDDQAETMLLNLLRGAGVHGAAGMSERRGRLLRPLLDVPREAIVAYAEHHDLAWIEDDSNLDTAYRRNFIRHKAMPLIESSFPQTATTLARAAQSFKTAAELLDELAVIDMGNEKRLQVARLRDLSSARAANLLAYCLRRHGAQIASHSMLNELLRQLIDAGCDSEIRIVVGSHEIRRFHDEVWIEKPTLPVSAVEWRGEAVVPWDAHCIRTCAAEGSGLAASVLDHAPLRFAPRRGGEVLQLRHDGPRRPLKDLLREAGVPPWRRKTLPLLFCGDELVWAAGIGIASKYRCKPAAAGFLIEFDGVTW